MNNEEILDRIYDLANENGMKIGDFVEALEADYNAKGEASESPAAENEPVEEMHGDTLEEIKRFRKAFPDIKADDIPESVWDEVKNGVSLTHAYALYFVNKANGEKAASEVNERNSVKGAAVKSDGATEEAFTREQVEKMDGKEVKKNYKNILKAMKNWHFN